MERWMAMLSIGGNVQPAWDRRDFDGGYSVVKSWQRLVWIGILAGLICASLLPLTRVEAGFPRQVTDPDQRARALLSRLTPEEKVGQLFLITFRGRDVTSKDAKILD